MAPAEATPEIASPLRCKSQTPKRRGSSVAAAGRSVMGSPKLKSNEFAQANLMQGRGDLCGARLCFDVALARPIATTQNPLRGLGMQLERIGPSTAPQLRVAGIKENLGGVRTSVGSWNRKSYMERKQAQAVQCGDLVCPVGGSSGHGYDEILEELASSCSPKSKIFTVERKLGDVFTPPEVKYPIVISGTCSTLDEHGSNFSLPAASSRGQSRSSSHETCHPNSKNSGPASTKPVSAASTRMPSSRSSLEASCEESDAWSWHESDFPGNIAGSNL